jgi:hypothetical protein
LAYGRKGWRQDFSTWTSLLDLRYCTMAAIHFCKSRTSAPENDDV